MVLSEQEQSLISVVQALPPAEAVKVLHWACQFADLAGGPLSNGPTVGLPRIWAKRQRRRFGASTQTTTGRE